MAHRTNKSAAGTSFFGIEVVATPQQLIDAYGVPEGCNDGDDKVNMEWIMETEDGRIFTIYDWKEYRPLQMNEMIDWHIGGHSWNDTAEAANEVMDQI